jgi:hypothetical protein
MEAFVMGGNTMMNRKYFYLSAVLVLATAAVFVWSAQSDGKSKVPQFLTSDRCVACHNGLATSNGEDLSMGLTWKPTMMANAALDPYWHAGVRREVMDHPGARADIEAECSICHMPMAHVESKLAGQEGAVFSHLKFLPNDRGDILAADGVSCSLCHMIGKEKLGTRESFVGGFSIAGSNAQGERPSFGPYTPTAGHIKIMLTSTSGFRPVESTHLQESEVCATCHTLYTKAIGSAGNETDEFPEQVPYQEWLHSRYRKERSCISCHMPEVAEDVPISSIMGAPRSGVSRHTFLGGNFFMTGILNRYRTELNVKALPNDFTAAEQRIKNHLQLEAARISIGKLEVEEKRLNAEVTVENLGGHKLPTAYPSRRVWVHLTVQDKNKRTVFESGAVSPAGAIMDNDNDADATRFEPHYSEIRSSGQVQIYEAIMSDAKGAVTTGLLKAVRYLKDNRLLPRGFDKKTAHKDVAVAGNALEDADFGDDGDRIRYSIDLGEAQGPFQVEAALCFQPISYRWALNLKPYDAEEPRRFTRYYEAAAPSAMTVLARARVEHK